MTAARVFLCVAFLTTALAGSLSNRAEAASCVFVTPDGGLYAMSVPGPDTIEGALLALASPPFSAPDGRALDSAIPPGTGLISLRSEEGVTVVDFTRDIIGDGMDEARLEAIRTQVSFTLEINGVVGSVAITAAGKPLHEYLPPSAPVEPNPAGRGAVRLAAGTLAGKLISLSPGHGLKWSGSSWTTDRPVYCAPLNQEDYHNLEMGIYLETHLLEAGATVKTNRCTNKSYGNYSTGEPWWHMGPSYWLQHKGYPCSVYANSTGDCTLGAGASEANDNIRARGQAANYDGVDMHVAIHTNGLTGYCTGAGCPTGTGTYYDSGANNSGHAEWGAISLALATNIQNAVISAVRSHYPDSTWKNRGTPDFAGGNYESRIPRCAAALIEHGFHDTCDKDALYLQDDFFKSLSMWGMYKGICDYYGVAVTWDMYSSEVVSHDIPATLKVGQTVQAHITMRNHGVLWTSARAFRLGAVGDSDPFSATTRFNVPADIPPGASVTFTFTLTAPQTPGTYTTDWRMVRDGYTWFGAVAQRTIVVEQVDTTPPEIHSVNVTPTLAVAGDSLTIEVEATDANLVSSVTAAGLPLSHVSDTVWSRSIVAQPGLGEHQVPVTATDTKGNTANATGTYTIARVIWGTNAVLSQDPLIPLVTGEYLFSAWGRVNSVTADGFVLDDASGSPVQVNASGHTLAEGNLAAARGILDRSTTPVTLTCQPVHVRKLN